MLNLGTLKIEYWWLECYNYIQNTRLGEKMGKKSKFVEKEKISMLYEEYKIARHEWEYYTR